MYLWVVPEQGFVLDHNSGERLYYWPCQLPTWLFPDRGLKGGTLVRL